MKGAGRGKNHWNWKGGLKNNPMHVKLRKHKWYLNNKGKFNRLKCIDCYKILGINSKNGKVRRCKKCVNNFVRSENHHAWRGGRLLGAYVYIMKKDHPHCTKRGYVLEHRLVMEKHLGRYLKQVENVHHINEIKHDNRLENLMLFPNKASHIAFHRRLDAHRNPS